MKPTPVMAEQKPTEGTSKPPPICKKCGKAHWPFKPCEGKISEEAIPQKEEKAEDVATIPEAAEVPITEEKPAEKPIPEEPKVQESHEEQYQKDYCIVASFNIGAVIYGPGEILPEGLSQEKITELYETGRIGHVTGDGIKVEVKLMDIPDARIEILARSHPAVIRNFLKSKNISKLSFEKLLNKYIEVGKDDNLIKEIASEIEKRS